jgi:hypothetical protein
VAWLSLAVVLLAFGIAAGAAFLARRGRRPLTLGPDARELALEAELQEIIAEERARQAAHTPDPD